jgi:hypothetical protein
MCVVLRVNLIEKGGSKHDVRYIRMTEFWVIMVKRNDGKVYCDLHKTDGKFYLTEQEAEYELKSRIEACSDRFDIDITNSYHIVKLLATLND